MSAREQRQPGPDHPITVTPSKDHIVVRVAGHVLADTRASLSLQEASYPVVHYLPRQDVDMSLLERTDHHTYCPYKGDCSYFSIPSAGERGTNAVWTYEHPYDAVAEIRGYLAFYGTRVDAIEVTPG
ncbi:DUF427 domain-containing protein [Dyella telluris]|uniref:DUF427 domain-containing protein n=1 Tax=Dyella telluris TaxID=2763498 RepID=A0A7G8Q283_9GAMM|nr:DUF427 domain-containing protein [Dyella telluris]QNK00891.1 DUF427 domain-containing protein [Dyella telluris]